MNENRMAVPITTAETRWDEHSCPFSSRVDWGSVPLNYAARLRLDLSKGSAFLVGMLEFVRRLTRLGIRVR